MISRFLSALAVCSAIGSSIVVAGQARRPEAGAATGDEARKFLADANRELLRLITEANRAGWVQVTYITPDTEALARTSQRAAGECADEICEGRAPLRQRHAAGT
jgi:hypothetical protein